MPIRRLPASVSALLFALVALATPLPSTADCQPAPPIDEALRTAPIAFVGIVIAVDGPLARFAVTEVWAGDVGPTVEVRGLADLGSRDGGFGAGFSEDDRHWTEDETYLVLPYLDAGVLRDHLCTATTEWRAELAALRPANAVIVEPAAVDGELPVALLALAAVAAAAVLVGVVAFTRR